VLDSSGQSTFQSKVHIDMPCYIPTVGVFSTSFLKNNFLVYTCDISLTGGTNKWLHFFSQSTSMICLHGGTIVWIICQEEMHASYSGVHNVFTSLFWSKIDWLNKSLYRELNLATKFTNAFICTSSWCNLIDVVHRDFRY
jgi:hypothetical protein